MSRLVKVLVIATAMLALSSCSDSLMCNMGFNSACIRYNKDY